MNNLLWLPTGSNVIFGEPTYEALKNKTVLRSESSSWHLDNINESQCYVLRHMRNLQLPDEVAMKIEKHINDPTRVQSDDWNETSNIYALYDIVDGCYPLESSVNYKKQDMTDETEIGRYQLDFGCTDNILEANRTINLKEHEIFGLENEHYTYWKVYKQKSTQQIKTNLHWCYHRRLEEEEIRYKKLIVVSIGTELTVATREHKYQTEYTLYFATKVISGSEHYLKVEGSNEVISLC